MDTKRDTIFLSHATPADNEFTIWLASRLKLLGYKVWVDKEGLLGCEVFWETIDNVIRNETVKFLLIYSNNIFQKESSGKIIPGRLKDGVSKEFTFAESIAKSQQLKDFIGLLNIDASDYNLFIGSDRLNQIPFYDNWATGLEQLVKKLEKDNIPKFKESGSHEFGDWYENEMTIVNGIIEKKEVYYSNWWEIKNLPESFFIYQFDTEKQAKLYYDKLSPYPISKSSNCLASFSYEKEFSIEHEGQEITLNPEKFEIKVTDVLLGFEKSTFPTHRDTQNHFKQLLKRIFHLLMKNRKLFWYEMSNKKLAYYYTPANLPNNKIKFQYPFKENPKPKTKNLLGVYQQSSYWHYALSAKPILSPLVGFSLKNHLTFSDDGFTAWEDKDKIHSHRRRKAKLSRYFNEDWRDFQCAFLNALTNDSGSIELALNKEFNLKMGLWPEMFWADFGYYEPSDKERQSLMNDFTNDNDDVEEISEPIEELLNK